MLWWADDRARVQSGVQPWQPGIASEAGLRCGQWQVGLLYRTGEFERVAAAPCSKVANQSGRELQDPPGEWLAPYPVQRQSLCLETAAQHWTQGRVLPGFLYQVRS